MWDGMEYYYHSVEIELYALVDALAKLLEVTHAFDATWNPKG